MLDLGQRLGYFRGRGESVAMHFANNPWVLMVCTAIAAALFCFWQDHKQKKIERKFHAEFLKVADELRERLESLTGQNAARHLDSSYLRLESFLLGVDHWAVLMDDFHAEWIGKCPPDESCRSRLNIIAIINQLQGIASDAVARQAVRQ